MIRSIFLGDTVDASAAFFEGADVVNPIDPVLYPAYRITDVNNDFIDAGIGTFSALDNLYHANISIPENAPISTDAEKYLITWLMKGSNKKEYQVTEYFEVLNPNFNEVALKEIQSIVLSGNSAKLSAPFPTNSAVTVTAYYNDTEIFSDEATPSGSYNTYYIFNIEIPAENLSLGEILVLWQAGDITFHQKVNVINRSMLVKITDLRMYLDKVHKDIDLYTGYRDSDLYFYIMQGLNMVNIVSPISEWKITDFYQNGSRNGISFVLNMAASYCALNAQYLAEGDSVFDYSGQPVTLSVDRTGFIESQLSRIKDYLNNEFKEYKKNLSSLNTTFHLGVPWPDVSGYYGLNQQHRGIPLRPLMIR